MPTAASPRTDASRPAVLRRLGWIFPAAIILLSALWIAQGPLLRLAARLALPSMARSAGYELEFDVLESRFFGPLLLGNVRLRDARGTDLRASQVELAVAAVPELFSHPNRIFRRIKVTELSGGYRLAVTAEAGGSAPSAAVRHFFTPAWPLIIEVDTSKVFVSRGDRHLLLKDTRVLLTEESTGVFRAGEIGLWSGSWTKTFPGLSGVTAWRDGVAYLADAGLDKDIVVELFSAVLGGPDAFTLKARAFGGSVYVEWTATGPDTTAALSAFGCQLDGLGRLLDLESPLSGKLDLLKFVFNGDLSAPLDAQSSLRVEAKDFAWDKRTFEDLRVGASLSGRRLKIDELQLAQKSNRVTARGLLDIPDSDWRGSELSLDLDATAKDVRALTDLFGRPWNKLSGGLEAQAQITGRLGEPSGWLKARGWDLRVPGVPPGTLQADITFAEGNAKIAVLESHSGPNFVRASGEVSLKEPLAYRGRLEARIREASRYLENLGRFAPDWARQGGAFVFWDGDGTANAHSGVVSLELFDFTGELNPVPLNGSIAASYSPGNVYVSRLLLDRGPLSLSASCYLSGKGLSVQDIQLFNLRDRLLRAEVFLPVSYPLLLEGKTWSQTMLPGGDIYAMVRSDDLRLGPLANLFGQEATAEGRVDWKLDASGPWENPSGESILAIDGFRAAFDSFAIPSSRVAGKAVLASQRLDISGELDTDAADPVKLAASIPLLGRKDDGGWRVLDRSKPAGAKLEVPPLDLKNFAGSKPLSGELSGSVSLSGQLSAPVFEGALAWSKVSFVPVDGLDAVTDFAGRYVFAGSAGKFESANGKMGEGIFTLEGGADYSDLLKVKSTAKISGRKLQLLATEKYRCNADLDLSVEKSTDKRTVTGDVALVGSTANIALSASPFLMPMGGAIAPIALTAPFRVVGWFADHDSNIRVHTAEPVQLPAGATASLDVFLTGPLGKFVPVGLVEVTGLQAALPSGPMNFPRAKFTLTREMPWVPFLDVSGRAQAGAYQATATAWGPLGEHQFRLESVPELFPEQIALLLGAGLAPEADARGYEFQTEQSEKTQELPPPQIGFTWRVE